MATDSLGVTEGSGVNVATHSFSEDNEIKHIERVAPGTGILTVPDSINIPDISTKGVYPTEIPTEVQIFYPEANEDDAYWRPNAGPYINETLQVANNNGGANLYCRFKSVTIPQGVTLASAFVKYTMNSNKSGISGSTLMSFAAMDNVTTVPNTFTELNNLTRTTNKYSMSMSGTYTNGTQYSSGSLLSAFQEIIDRSGWSSGNNAFFLWDRSSMGGTQFDVRSIATGDGSDKMEFHVVYFDPSLEYLYCEGKSRIILKSLFSSYSCNGTTARLIFYDSESVIIGYSAEFGINNLRIGTTDIETTEWTVDSNFTTGDYIVPTTSNDHYYKETGTGGTGGSSEPTWPIDGGNVSDGDCTWTDEGEIQWYGDLVIIVNELGATKFKIRTSDDLSDGTLDIYSGAI